MKAAASILLGVIFGLGSAAAHAQSSAGAPRWGASASSAPKDGGNGNEDGGASASAPQKAAEQRARALFAEGNSELAFGRYEEARAKFRQAYEAWANPKILLNLATTLRALGRYREALHAYQRYLEGGEPDAARRLEVDEICSQLEQRLGRVRVHLDEAVQRLSVDGQPTEVRSELSVLLDPGRHVLVAHGPSGSEVRELEIEAGSQHTIDLRTAPNTEVTAEDETGDEPQQEPAPGRYWGVIGRIDMDGRARGGVGALGISHRVASWLQVSGGALVGASMGGWLGLRADLSRGTLRPSLSASVPVFFVESVAVGISGAAGLRWQASESLSLLVQGGVVHFPSVPTGYETTTFVPSIGSELLL